MPKLVERGQVSSTAPQQKAAAPGGERDEASLRLVNRALVLDGGQVALEALPHVRQLLRIQQAARRCGIACHTKLIED